MATTQAHKNTTKLSIIIPCLNEGQRLEQCLIDLQPLRSVGHELILVDGGSEEEEIGKMEPFVDKLLHTSPGRAGQMNRGASKASGDLYWFLHADSRIKEGMDKAILAAAAATTPLWGRFDVRLSGSHPLLRIVERMMNWRSRISGIATGDQGIFIHRRLFEQVGGFPPQPLMEDIEISRRLKGVSFPVCLPGPLVASSRRWESQGIVRTIALMWMLRLAYWAGISPRLLARLYTPVIG